MIDNPAPVQRGSAEPVPRRLPPQGAVYRSTRLTRMVKDIKVTEAGEIVQILRYPVFGPYGPDPGDPAGLSPGVNPFAVGCGALPAHAAALCGAIGYW